MVLSHLTLFLDHFKELLMKSLCIILLIFTLSCNSTYNLSDKSYKVKKIFDNFLPGLYLIEVKTNNSDSKWVISEKEIIDSSTIFNDQYSQIKEGQIFQTSLTKLDTTIIFNSEEFRGSNPREYFVENNGILLVRNDTLIVDIFKSKEMIGNYIKTNCVIR